MSLFVMDRSPDIEAVKILIKSVLGSSSTQLNVYDLCRQYVSLAGHSLPFAKFGFRNVLDFLNSMPDTVQVNGSGFRAWVIPVLKPQSAHILEMIAKQRTPKNSKPWMHKPKNSAIYVANDPNTPSTSSSNQSSPNTPKLSPPEAIQKTTMRPVNSPSPSVSESDTPSSNSSSLSGNSEVIAKIPSFQICVNLQTPDGQPIRSVTEIRSRTNTRNVPQHVQTNLRQLVRSSASGIWLQLLPNAYEKKFQTRLDYTQYGYESLLQMCLDLPTIFQYKQSSMDDGKVFDAALNVMNGDGGDDDDEAYLARLVANCDISQNANVVTNDSKFPTNVMKSGESLPAEKYPFEIDDNAFVPVVIGEAYSISHFWFTLEQNEEELAILQSNMQQFYDERKEQYKIHATQLSPKLYCVVEVDDLYARAVIVAVRSEQQIQVFCFDVGTTIMTTANRIFLLCKTFCALPRQGLKGYLAGIVPPLPQTSWTTEAVLRFVELVKEKVVFAGLGEIESHSVYDPIHGLVLLDSPATDVCVQKVLIDEDFAMPLL